jgi:putative transcriptional regulator
VRRLRTWLKQKRIGKKLTQAAVAKKSGISRSFYTHIENGTKTPSVLVAKKIAKTLDFDWTLFFENECSLKEHSRVKEVC